mmetsp:Transcript_14952/g.42565  ORF Transcript_14952/g.42565 Transcript_14952/m.42565 type:complete len:323 (-) Transcript_14952:458-1426(-)
MQRAFLPFLRKELGKETLLLLVQLLDQPSGLPHLPFHLINNHPLLVLDLLDDALLGLQHPRLQDREPLSETPQLGLYGPLQRLHLLARKLLHPLQILLQLLKRPDTFRLRRARVVRQRKVVPCEPRPLSRLFQLRHVRLRQAPRSSVHGRPSIPFPSVILSPIIYENVLVRLGGQDVPVVFVMQVLVSVVEQDRRVFLLHESLHRRPLQKVLAVVRRYPPVNLADDDVRVRRRRGKVVLLAGERVKQPVQAGGDVPAALEICQVEFRVQSAVGRHRVDALIHALRHALLLAHGALVERVDCRVLVLVAAFDLTFGLAVLAVA